MTTAEELAWAAIEIAENSPAFHEEVRKLTGEWMARQPQPIERVTYTLAEDLGEEIKNHIKSWYGLLADDEESFPGGLLARFLSMADWPTVGKYYLDDHTENRTAETA